jgi:hypothetical protein
MTSSARLHGNVRVDVLDERGETLLAHGHLRLEPAPPAGEVERGRFEPDARFEVGDGAYVLRLPSGEKWEVELRRTPEAFALAVISDETPARGAFGGE